jgi:prepilin-type processing-associated H-X9-DG protein
MARPVVVGVIVLVLIAVAGGVVLTLLPKQRAAANLVTCRNNLREVTQFAATHAQTQPGQVPARKAPDQIPAGTIVLPGVPPEERLSWLVGVLSGFDQKRQDPAAVLAAIDTTQPWAAEKNQQAARARLPTLLCPGNPPAVLPDHPAPTSYVGIAGLGADAATLAIPPGGPAPPRAGCFRYDAPTPLDLITDGLSQTILVGERSGDLGPWLRGGPATVRGFDDAPAAPPVLGPGGQFGGCHPNGANLAFADGSVRFFTEQADPRVLFGLATIAGKGHDPVPED